MIDYSKIQVPRMSQKDFTAAAASFRKQYWQDKDSPVDIHGILEFDLDIEIIPLPNLEQLCNTSALITSDWGSVYIDHDQYSDERRDKRTNFCIAHEIGHMVFHRALYESLQIQSFEDFYRFFSDCPREEYNRLEDQAHAFAGRLLVPRNELEEQLKTVLGLSRKGQISPNQVMRTLSDKFQVSDDVLIRRIRFEKIDIDPSLVEPV